MKVAIKYKDEILLNFYLDEDDITVRRKKDCVMKKFKAHDIVIPYKYTGKSKINYGGVHVPKTRTTIGYHWLLVLLRGLTFDEKSVIDHIDGDPTNNTRSNLRVVTQQVNCKNSKMRSSNTSGYNGLTFHKPTGRFVVRRAIAGKRIWKSAKTKEEAIKLWKELEILALADGYTERHGK